MKSTLKIFGFTVLVVAFYSYVGQMVPQQRAYPPETAELSVDMSTEEMVQEGENIVGGKGTCLTCHAIGGEEGARFPDLANIGAVAGERRDGYSDIEYLAESLYEPNAYVVEGYTPGMPQASTPPVDLSDQEIKAVIAYLQSLGGTPTIAMDTPLEYETSDSMEEDGTSAAATETEAAPSAEATAAGGAAAGDTTRGGEELFNEYLCNTCHSIDEPADMVGPSLHDVGSRMTQEEIHESIMEPDAEVREGFPAGTMRATLEGVGFYEQVSEQELQTMVDFLAAQTGD